MNVQTKERLDGVFAITAWIIFPVIAYLVARDCGVDITRDGALVAPAAAEASN